MSSILGLMSGTLIGLAARSFSNVNDSASGERHAKIELFMFPPAPPLLPCALLNSVFVTLDQGGIRWRDKLYSLESFRAGNVR
jgi:hypothetical protein